MKARPQVPAMSARTGASTRDGQPHGSRHPECTHDLSEAQVRDPNASMPPRTGYNVEYVEQVAQLIVKPGGIAEVRVLRPSSRRDWGNVASGYFDNPHALAHEVARLDGRAEGIYITLQEIEPTLIARAKNRLEGWAKSTTSDADVLSYRWLPIDVDAVRPSGVSATDQELADALATRDAIAGFLEESGWPDPLVAISGNGGHLLFRLPDIPVDQGREWVEKALKSLAAQFDTDQVKVDTSLHNPSRIIRLYGTTVAKGDSTAERPHSRSRLEPQDADPIPVTPEQLRWLTEQPVAVLHSGL